MSNPFDDLESGENGAGSGSEDEDSSNAGNDVSTTTTEPAAEPTTDTASASAVDESTPTREPAPEPKTESSPADSGPAFEYSEVRQKPLYARDETWTEFEKTLRTTISPQLAEAGVLDEETREIHDAVLRLAVANPDEVADLLLEARRES